MLVFSSPTVFSALSLLFSLCPYSCLKPFDINRRARSFSCRSNAPLSEVALQEILFSRYDGERIGEYYNRRPLQVLNRIVTVGFPVLGWWTRVQVDKSLAKYQTEDQNVSAERQRARELRDAIVQGKSVTFIKSGQALALRTDLIKSVAYTTQLQTLQDEVGTFDNKIAMRIISDELDAQVRDVFEFDPVLPIASASIGQVYRGRIKSTGAAVAVKVQRPDAITQVGIDLHILRLVARYVKKRYKLRSDWVGIVDEFGAQLFQELNYVQEGRNCQKFKSLYGTIPGIYVPDIYESLTTRRVLTMEFVEGTKGPWKEGGERLLTIGLQCSVLQLLGSGYFHSDPHRGNLLQTPSGDLAYLDFGMMSEVPARKRFAMIGSVLGLVNKDISMVIRSMSELEFFPPGTDTEVVISSLTNALQNSTDGAGSAALNFTKLNENLSRISDKLPFRLPPYYTMVIRSLTILEGLALVVDPNFRLVRGAYPFVARQILTSSSPELTELLKAVLLTKEGRINWKQLQQFVSISSKADAAMRGDYAALQSAQNQSDVVRIYQAGMQDSAEEDAPAFTAELALLMLDYLLSSRGEYLRAPLVEDLADLLDQLGLVAQSVAALGTNNLIPGPATKPSRDVVLQLLTTFQELAASSNGRLNHAQADAPRLAVLTRGLGAVRGFLRAGTEGSADAVLGKLLVLLRQVAVKLVERRAQETVRRSLSPGNVQRIIPALSRIFDFVS